MKYDLSGFVCPISKIKASQVIDGLSEGETAEIILGDSDSFKSVAQELKARGIVPGFEQKGDSQFVLTITK